MERYGHLSYDSDDSYEDDEKCTFCNRNGRKERNPTFYCTVSGLSTVDLKPYKSV